MTMLLREVTDDDGRSAFGEWLDQLDVVPGAKVRVALARMSQGNLSAVKWFRGIGEYKIDFGPGSASTLHNKVKPFCCCWQGAPRSNNSAILKPRSCNWRHTKHGENDGQFHKGRTHHHTGAHPA
jgi:putative component of toxin-antitoxin plasmid stabilization module